MAKLFNPRYLYCNPEEFLEGKEVFLGDSREYLIENVEKNCPHLKGICKFSNNSDRPFEMDDKPPIVYRYAYYDPYYKVKRAFAEGKSIEYRKIKSNAPWRVSTSGVVDPDVYEYRIKPITEKKYHVYQLITELVVVTDYIDGKNVWETYFTGSSKECSDWIQKHCRLMTNRELSRWVGGKCFGEVREIASTQALTQHVYNVQNSDKPVPECTVVRDWDYDYWVKPLVLKKE